MRKQRIYISGPITGHPDYKEHFAQAADIVRKNGCHAVNPTTMFGWFQPLFAICPYRLQIFIDCLVLTTCKGIFLMAGYETSRGAKLEKAVADFLDMEIIEEHHTEISNQECEIMETIKSIRKELPDALLVQLGFDVVLSKQHIIEKINLFESTFGGMAVHYERSGRRVEIIYSKEVNDRWHDKLNKGQKVRVGNQSGVLAEDGAFWIGTERCLYVNLGKSGEVFDIIHITPE